MVLWFLCCLKNQSSRNSDLGAVTRWQCQWWGTTGREVDQGALDTCLCSEKHTKTDLDQDHTCTNVASSSKLKAGVRSTFLHNWETRPCPHATFEWLGRQGFSVLSKTEMDHSQWFPGAEPAEPTAATFLVLPNSPVSWTGADTGNSEYSSSYHGQLSKGDHHGRRNKFKILQSTSARHVIYRWHQEWAQHADKSGKWCHRQGKCSGKQFCLFTFEHSVQWHQCPHKASPLFYL